VDQAYSLGRYMNRVLVTGGAGRVGAAVVRRLLRDPDYEVRVSDRRVAPGWMREGCEVHNGDLRVLAEARKAIAGCSHVVHLAAMADVPELAHTLTEVNAALHNAVFRAALDEDVARFVYVSSSSVFERATEFPTTEEHLLECPIPLSPRGFSKLSGEMYCRAAHAEHGLPHTICRPSSAYGRHESADDSGLVADLLRRSGLRERPLPIPASGEHTRTPTHVDDVAEGIVTAMSQPAGLNEDFNLAAAEELTIAEIAALCWEACGNDPDELALSLAPDPGMHAGAVRSLPSAEKAQRLLGWEARISAREGISGCVEQVVPA
jgi:UDP-glucose 4-epimerase